MEQPRLLGRISADQVVPYPPGIPVLVPGQRISEDVLDFLLSCCTTRAVPSSTDSCASRAGPCCGWWLIARAAP
jgi:arginine/lysine/ornithine decarboxylase